MKNRPEPAAHRPCLDAGSAHPTPILPLVFSYGYGTARAAKRMAYLRCTVRALQGTKLLLRQHTAAILVFSLLGMIMPCFAAENYSQPLWELGLVGGTAWIPDYPAADENHPVGLVLPYFIYRGKIFRAGDDGLARGRFLRGDRHEFDISIGGSFRTDSTDNEARRGMSDLDFLFEVGPRLKLTLIQLEPNARITLELPVRAVISIDLDEIGYRGLVFNPKLAYTRRNIFDTGIHLKVSGGPIFATEELMDYFYEVAAKFVTPKRPAFDADAGYLGTEFTIFVRKQLSRRLSVFSAVRVDYFKGATNDDSPLFRSDVNVGVGVGFAWSLYRSKRQITE